MELNIAPEKSWEKLAKIIFKENIPKDIEFLMQKGFKDSLTEIEKWQRLFFVVELLIKTLI